MAIKRYFTFPKAPGLQPHPQMQFSIISRTLIGVGSFLSAEIHWMYSSAPANWAVLCHEVPFIEYIYLTILTELQGFIVLKYKGPLWFIWRHSKNEICYVDLLAFWTLVHGTFTWLLSSPQPISQGRPSPVDSWFQCYTESMFVLYFLGVFQPCLGSL